MTRPCAALVAAALGARCCVGGDASFPVYPFTRALEPGGNVSGSDVFILQSLLHDRSRCGPAAATSVFDGATSACLAAFQLAQGLPQTGALDATTAVAVLAHLGPDGYIDDGAAPKTLGFSYKIVVRLDANRSVEATARLIDKNGTEVFSFIVRTHGAEGYPVPPWPSWNSSDSGLNQFSSDGATPTGLVEVDLNSPEDNATEFGPYPINRAVRGRQGNWRFLATNNARTMVRDGILLHTGEWPGWSPPMAMPNSLGCLHAWPASIERLWRELVALGVSVRPNTNGALPYPYRSQGLLSIECALCASAK